MVWMKRNSLDILDPRCSISLSSPQCQHMSQMDGGRASAGGLRQQVAVEADGGEWKRAAAFVTATACGGGGVKPSSPPVTCPVRNVLLYLSQRPRRVTNTTHTPPLRFLFLFSIKYITVATRPALTGTTHRLGALDKDSAVTTAYTNHHHGRHHRPWRDVPAHGH